MRKKKAWTLVNTFWFRCRSTQMEGLTKEENERLKKEDVPKEGRQWKDLQRRKIVSRLKKEERENVAKNERH